LERFCNAPSSARANKSADVVLELIPLNPAAGRDAELLYYLPSGSLSTYGCTAMDAINRSAGIVMPAQPLLDWLRQADPTSAELSLEDLRREPTIYLLPEYASEEEVRAYLKESLQRDL